MIKLFRYLRPYRFSVSLSLVLIFVQSLADLSLPTLMSDMVDRGIASGDTDYILRIGAWMVLLATLGIFCHVASGYLSARISMGFGRDLRHRVFQRVLCYSLQEMDRIGTSSLITRTTNDVTQIQQVLFMLLRIFAWAPLMAAGGIVMAIGLEPKLAWILMATIPVMASVFLLLAWKGIPLFQLIQARLDVLNRVLRESLTGIRVIRAFDRVDFEQQRFDRANSDLTEMSLRVNRLMAAFFPAVLLVVNMTTLVILWYGSHNLHQGEIRIGALMAFLQYAMQILFSTIMVSVVFIMVPRASASASRIHEVLDRHPTLFDPPRPQKPSDRRGEVEFRQVTFCYPGAEQPAIRNISFRAGAGEFLGIIGGTGSGKTTLIHLIPRFYDASSGAVLVDGTDVREMTQEDLRSRIGFVSQKALLFTGSVEDNLRFGKETATSEEIRQAADIAQATEFIQEKEEGFRSPVAQAGANLSGGQRQRLSIARALVRRPEIYIFDDSFSALDFKTDARLRARLRQETAGATVLLVAQRVSTVMSADRILVLEDGQLVGLGAHRELMEACPVYREIVFSQLSAEELP